MTLYLDASVVVPLVVTEAATETMHIWLGRQDEELCVGRLAIGDAGSAISRRRRMGQLSDDEGGRALSALDDWLVATATIVDHEPRDVAEAALLVRRPLPKLLTPDAIHLATCRRLGHRFVTGDRDLTLVAAFLRLEWISPA